MSSISPQSVHEISLIFNTMFTEYVNDALAAREIPLPAATITSVIKAGDFQNGTQYLFSYDTQAAADEMGKTLLAVAKSCFTDKRLYRIEADPLPATQPNDGICTFGSDS